MRKQIMEKMSVVLNSSMLPWVIISIGIILRIIPYLFNRSLWLDESYLALNIIERSYSELLQPLSYGQGAPFGFLMAQKAMFYTFGGNEFSLRFIPLLSGVVSLLVFYKLTGRLFKQKAVLIGIGLFSISKSLIYYSSEVKQYSSDVAIALILFYMTVCLQDSRKISGKSLFLYGIVGGISIWFSHPSIFVLAGCAASLTYFCVTKREWDKVYRLCIAYAFWMINFVGFYLISLHKLNKNSMLLEYWAGGFMPFPPMSKQEIKWYIDTFFNLFSDPVGISLYGIAAFAFLVGCVSLFYEARDKFYLVIMPLILTLLASGLHKYPFSGRLILFLVPSLLIFIAAGTARILDKTSTTCKAMGIIFICLLFFNPVITAATDLQSPYHEETRNALEYISRNQQDGDIVYLYHFTIWPFKYYKNSYDFSSLSFVSGVRPVKDWNIVANDLNKLKGNKRVWILLSLSQEKIGVSVDKLYLYHLDNMGRRLNSFTQTGAAAYLYDLSEKSDLQQVSSATPSATVPAVSAAERAQDPTR